MQSNQYRGRGQPIQLVIDESLSQYSKSKFRSVALEVFAYVLAILLVASGLVVLAYGIRDDDRDAILVSVPIFVTAIVSFFVISAFAHLLGNSAHQLRLAAYDFHLQYNVADNKLPDG